MRDQPEHTDLQLTAVEKAALLALGKISAGERAFLNVIDADSLVHMGLAESFGMSQFALTEQGRSLLDKLQPQLRL
ncbi:MAG TPA: hypothetical protein VN428_22775 [Bryobacteraceae bacterium]|nr:hypothetical protein [Bryobacteraceae bacterium]